MKYSVLSTILIIVASSLLFDSCKKKEEEENAAADAELYNAVKSDNGYTYFQNGDLLSGKAPSPHGSFKLRFNATAAAALDTSGYLPSGSSFPNGSIIVKDIYKNGALDLIAVMKKDPGNDDAASGWIWSEYEPDGTVFYSISSQGDQCTACHSTSANRDLTKTFDLH